MLDNKKINDLSIICDVHWDVVFDQTELGFWEFIPSTGALRTTSTCKKNFGLEVDDIFTYDRLLSMILPEDLESVQDEIHLAILKEKDSCDAIYRVACPDGSTRWIKADGILIEREGEILQLIGTTLDITALQSIQLASKIYTKKVVRNGSE